MDKPSVFISYAHKDGLDFTRRLAFALSVYMDVFWDRRLQAGEFAEQLYSAIDSRDHFLLVMTPHSVASEWCQKELAYAQKKKKQISLAMVFDPEQTGGEHLTKDYTYGAFHEDFEVGFRRVTEMLLGEARSSWEYLIDADLSDVYKAWAHGHIPGLIMKSLVGWLFVEVLAKNIEESLAERSQIIRIPPLPAMPQDYDYFITNLLASFAAVNDASGVGKLYFLSQMQQQVKQILELKDDEHGKLCELTGKLHRDIEKKLQIYYYSTLQADKLGIINQYHNIRVGSKLRELITIHARRSKYLY